MSTKLNIFALERTCPDPFLDNGVILPINQAVFAVGDQANFVCNKGFVLNGRKTLTCEMGGEWSDDFPTCERKYFTSNRRKNWWNLLSKAASQLFLCLSSCHGKATVALYFGQTRTRLGDIQFPSFSFVALKSVQIICC